MKKSDTFILHGIFDLKEVDTKPMGSGKSRLLTLGMLNNSKLIGHVVVRKTRSKIGNRVVKFKRYFSGE